MIKTSIDVQNLKSLEKHIKLVNSFMKDNMSKLIEYIANKSLIELNDVISERLKSGTTNDEYIEDYKKNNILEPIDGDYNNGFIIYNHTMADISELKDSTINKYPNGFSIALAFEYGVGIVGQNSPVNGAWKYNVNNYNWAWKYKKNGNIYFTYGYEGMEIYRFAKERIQQKIPTWIKEYSNKEV